MLLAAASLSGVAGLIFELAWFHRAGLVFGSSVWSTSLVLSAFMGGLMLGSALITRLGARILRPGRTYAVAEFVVAISTYVGTATSYADVLLPATTFLEGYDFARAYGPLSLQLVRPVIEPVGEARTNADVFAELGRRLGVFDGVDPQGELDLLVKVIDGLPPSLGDDLRTNTRLTPDCGANPVQFIDVFPRTADGKVHLFDDGLDASAPAGLYGYQPDPASEAYPLALISPASDRTISSTLGELPRPDARLTMHPQDAAARGLEDKDLVRVYNALGEIQLPLSVSPAVPPGTVSLPKGLWRRSTHNNSTSTSVVPDTLTDIAGGACFNDARVQVASVPQA